MRNRNLASLAFAALPPMLLSACGGAAPLPRVQSASVIATPPPSPASVRRPVKRRLPPPPMVQALPGLETVIGSTASDLTRQFGSARLDVWEGDARKLQYSGTACVLDVYLYPTAQSREPRATYIDARRASDGQDVDRLACVTSLRKP